jgi:hypothetical protein
VSYLRAFAPWIVFALIPSGDWKWAALIALAVSAAGIVLQRRAGLPLDAQIIELGSAVYFAALTVLAFADPHTPLHAYTSSMANGALAVIALGSLLLNKPFTLGIAKQTTPRELWNHPGFLRTNTVITSAWAASFVVACVLLALLAHSSAGGRTVVQVAAFVVPLVFTLRYVARVQARAAEHGIQIQA